MKLSAWAVLAFFLLTVVGDGIAVENVPSQVAQTGSGGGPRPGKYKIFAYGRVASPPLYLGYFILGEDGTYKAFLPGDKPRGEGRYEYDAAKKTVKWIGGPHEKEWGGEFTEDRGGKTHKIRLKRTTIGTNSTDGK